MKASVDINRVNLKQYELDNVVNIMKNVYEEL